MATIPGLENINWSGIASQGAYWLGWSLLFLLVVAVFIVLYFAIQYKYKAIIRVVDTTGHVRDIKRDKIREIKKNGVVTNWSLLKCRKKISPLSADYIWPKKTIFLDQIDADTFIPTPFKEMTNYDLTPASIKLWAVNEIKDNFDSYTMKQGWDKYKDFALTLGVVLLCMIIVGVTIYLTYKYHSAALGKTDTLVNALQNFNRIPEVGPR